MNRRQFLKGAAVAGSSAALLTGTYGHFVEPQTLTITNAIANPSRRLRVVQLSDLHLRAITAVHEKIVHELTTLVPDVLVLSGDVVDNKKHLGLIGEFLQTLPPQRHVIATLGNWEHWAGVTEEELRAIYEKQNVALMVNASWDVAAAGHTWRFCGLDDWTGGHPDYAKATESGIPDICIAHSPVYRDELMEKARVTPKHPRLPTMMLSGHTHGGQIKIGPFAPVRPRGSGRYIEGWYRDAWPWLFVSRGVGTSVMPVRIGSPPELVVFDL